MACCLPQPIGALQGSYCSHASTTYSLYTQQRERKNSPDLLGIEQGSTLKEKLTLSYTHVVRCSLYLTLQVALDRSSNADGEEIGRDLVPLWFPHHGEAAIPLDGTPHMTLAAILGRPEPI